MCSCCRCVRRWNNRASQTVNYYYLFIELIIFKVHFLSVAMGLWYARRVCADCCCLHFKNFKFTSSGFVIMNFRRNWSRHQNKQTKYARRVLMCVQDGFRKQNKKMKRTTERNLQNFVNLCFESKCEAFLDCSSGGCVRRSVGSRCSMNMNCVWMMTELKWMRVWGNEKRSQNI